MSRFQIVIQEAAKNTILEIWDRPFNSQQFEYQPSKSPFFERLAFRSPLYKDQNAIDKQSPLQPFCL